MDAAAVPYVRILRVGIEHGAGVVSLAAVVIVGPALFKERLIGIHFI
jgi:hypothetical protein